MGNIISKKDNSSVPPSVTSVAAAANGSSSKKGVKGWLPNPLGKKVVPSSDPGTSGSQLSNFLDSNGSILTKSNKSEFGQSLFQYSDSSTSTADQNKFVTISPVNFT